MSVLKNATVVIKGNDGGKTVTLTGNLKDVHIKNTTPVERVHSIWDLSPVHMLTPQTYSLDFTPDEDGHYFTVQTRVPSVTRTARVLGWEDPENAVRREPTIALLRDAARRADVNEDTDFSLIYERDPMTCTTKVFVEFTWED